MIIRFDQFLENVHILERIVRCKIFPHFCLERAIKPFDNRCLGFVVRREESNVMFLQKSLKLSIHKLHPFNSVKHFRFTPFLDYFLEGFDKVFPSFASIASIHAYLLSTSITVKTYCTQYSVDLMNP
jgi:hypothetical protein